MVVNIARRLAQSDRNASFQRVIVMDDVTPAMRLFRHGSFGPFAAVVRAWGKDYAVDPANDAARGLRVARRRISAISRIHEPTVHDEAQTRFGGVKSAGYDRFGGKADLDPLIKLCCITLDTSGEHFPM
ncbi:acyl-CoA reductase-like NAD-dependent aldehyde dehydrogenase [Rhizobium skierniewicense]|uniref:Acyl-CoA reductase-like NAD-dependent aldehyde dehydrogenase n=1 Tax=Rhizobium skierniewicense TaxID=984260 RepID=A0A7W6G286_9HYPH|nr:aldehyde dehydrogenase family protein [Rhizobium skierniewicense]MBB3945291.1 acyl-CoA reductase-like NAD-dependent aldehyde dehydrogenase [Rhizobium skierniewicense]